MKINPNTEKIIPLKISFYIFAAFAITFLLFGLFDFVDNFMFTPDQTIMNDFIKTRTTLLFSVMTGFAILSSIFYNLIQYEGIQQQNRLQVFEKKFYHWLGHLEGIVVNEMIWRNNRIVSRETHGRNVFRFYNEIYKRDWTGEVWALRYDALTDVDEKSKMRITAFKEYQSFFQHENNRGAEIFAYFIDTFQSIVELIDTNEDFYAEDQIAYLHILFAQLNRHQKFTMGMLIYSNVLYPELHRLISQYEEILNKYVIGYQYDYAPDYTVGVN